MSTEYPNCDPIYWFVAPALYPLLFNETHTGSAVAAATIVVLISSGWHVINKKAQMIKMKIIIFLILFIPLIIDLLFPHCSALSRNILLSLEIISPNSFRLMPE